jgi:hypothetical protein
VALFGKVAARNLARRGPKPRAVCAGDFLWKEPEKQSREVPAGRRENTERVAE